MTDLKHISIESFLTDVEEQQVIDAIRQAELDTSGEIRVHLEHACTNSFKRATEVFSILKMNNTRHRNGVLIYIAVKDHTFTIIGDKGIHAVVPKDFWDRTKDIIQGHFKSHEFVKGLTEGINLIGRELKVHFPWSSDDTNELSDSISKL